MNLAIYEGLTRYELLEIRRNLQDAYKAGSTGKRVSAVNVNGRQTTLELTTLAQIKRELTAVNEAIRRHPDTPECEKSRRNSVRRFQVNFQNNPIS